MARAWPLALTLSLLAGSASAQEDLIGDLLGGQSLPAAEAPAATAPAEAPPADQAEPTPKIPTAPQPELDEEGQVIAPPAPSASTPTPPPAAVATPQAQPAAPIQAEAPAVAPAPAEAPAPPTTAATAAPAPQAVAPPPAAPVDPQAQATAAPPPAAPAPAQPYANAPAQQPYAPPTPSLAAPPVANLPTSPIPYQALTPSPAAPRPSMTIAPYGPSAPSPSPTAPYATPSAPYTPSAATPPAYAPYSSPPMGLASAPPPSTGVQSGVRTPVHVDEHGRTPDAAPTYREIDYEQRLRSSYASAQGLQGPLDGSWTLAIDGDDRYSLQLVERSSGLLEGAWRDLKRTGSLNGTGFVEGIQRYGGQLTFSFRPDGRDELATATLTAGAEGRWSGELVRGKDRKTVTLRRQ